MCGRADMRRPRVLLPEVCTQFPRPGGTISSANQNRSTMAPTTVAQRLKSAREAAGFTQAQVAVQSGLGESSVSEFENGRREPSLAQLSALAAIYKKTLTWLIDDSADNSQLTVLWRDRPRADVAADVGSRFLQKCEWYRNLELWCGEVADCELPWMKPKPATQLSEHDSEALAKRVRDELALGDHPSECLLRTLEENCAVKVFFLDFEPTGTAACSYSAEFGAAILLNRKNKPWRRSFDISHELFHLLTWSCFNPTSGGETRIAPPSEERLANTFASALLLPAEPFRLSFARRASGSKLTDVEHAYSVAREFGVSVDAVAVRAKILGLIGTTEADALRSQWRTASMFYEDRVPEQPPNHPDRFLALAVAALRAGELSIGRFAEYTGCSRQTATDVARKQHDDVAPEDSATSP